MKKTIPILVSIIIGGAIWAFSPLFTGEVEPWDSDLSYLPIAIVITSLVLGFTFPRSFVVCTAGLMLGQMIYLGAFLPSGPLIIIGFLMLIGYSLVLSLPFTFIASLTRKRPSCLEPHSLTRQEAEQGVDGNPH